MKQFEFKLVVHEPGIANRVKGDDFGEDFKDLLAEHGRNGWDLKSVVREHGLRTVLIFSREVQSVAS